MLDFDAVQIPKNKKQTKFHSEWPSVGKQILPVYKSELDHVKQKNIIYQWVSIFHLLPIHISIGCEKNVNLLWNQGDNCMA